MEGLLLLEEQQTLMGPVSIHRMTHDWLWYITLVERQVREQDPFARSVPFPSVVSSTKLLTWIAL